MSSYKLIIFVICIFLTQVVYGQDPPKNARERKAVKMVNDLKEVKKAMAYFKKTGSPLHVYIDGRLGDDYQVRAAQFKGRPVSMTFTCYLFLVDPTRNTIKYWDIPDDTVISIVNWRKSHYKIDRPERK